MNKILLLIGALTLAACNSYTVENKMDEAIKAGETVISTGGCHTFSDGIFGMGSDWPMVITKEDGTSIVEGEDADTEWTADNYMVDANGVTATDEPCQTEPAEDEESTESGESATDNEDSATSNTPKVRPHPHKITNGDDKAEEEKANPVQGPPATP
ncbi:MAG: hypothetical protein OXN83_05715 [Oligoflexia bacterium]|nr:hypothetical protein [Oligoflexia bacterium]